MLPGVDLEQMIITVGYVGLFAIIFAESGLFFGFFLPGDSLLITAGVLASARPDLFSLPILIAVCFVAAVTGDAIGYTFGSRVGRRLYERPDSRFFRKSHLAAAEQFYERHGGKTIVLARFLPFVRTFAPIVAGTARMPYRRFALYNFTGAVLWAIGLPLAGFGLGEALGEQLDRYLLLVLAVVVALSILPTAIHLIRHNREEISARIKSRGREGAVHVEPLADDGVEP
ncbi:MAG: VTT domain-containing protein [Chloroflexi bacterium]|nr:VTT domain-containing protein [Chloroflexota bacterium]